ncbi:hypothetical protein KQX54_005023 [Cotesia glomerata]|uniref:Uncharacterized protein n=1 Tax=Cotesia glomerata TaxID=32391 RepID=A0AAV7J7G7_COTGL|nr:hypothetical protein KQX54_005023 [Cotesia glomerata]
MDLEHRVRTRHRQPTYPPYKTLGSSCHSFRVIGSVVVVAGCWIGYARVVVPLSGTTCLETPGWDTTPHCFTVRARESGTSKPTPPMEEHTTPE